jgi:hypothetical protein
MHNEKNAMEAIFNTFFDIPNKMKDNVKACVDQAELCNRPDMNMYNDPTTGKWKKLQADFA